MIGIQKSLLVENANWQLLLFIDFHIIFMVSMDL